MVRPGRDKLSGRVEVDEAYFGAPEKGGKRGRGTENKVLAIIAVEVADGIVGRIRIGIINDASSPSLNTFLESAVESGSTVITDGWSGYNGVEAVGYKHEILESENADELLPHVHIVISLIKRRIMGTLQGSYSKEPLAYYFDEYAFRFNRRKSKSRGLLFLRLLENAVKIDPVPYKRITRKC
jgi:transposase-like protein